MRFVLFYMIRQGTEIFRIVSLFSFVKHQNISLRMDISIIFVKDKKYRRLGDISGLVWFHFFRLRIDILDFVRGTLSIYESTPLLLD